MEQVYEVVVWLYPPDGIRFPAYVEEVQAAFPLAAVVVVMKRHRRTSVAYAAVKGDQGIVRFRRGVRITACRDGNASQMASRNVVPSSREVPGPAGQWSRFRVQVWRNCLHDCPDEEWEVEAGRRSEAVRLARVRLGDEAVCWVKVDGVA